MHAWTLHANDDDPKICPMWALIQLAVLYGENITLSGPLFLKVNKNGAIMQDTPVVRQSHSSSRCFSLIVVLCHRPAAHSAMLSQWTCGISVTSPGHSMVPTPSAEVDANIASRIKVGLLTWWLLGVAGHRLKPSPCSGIFILPMTTMSTWSTMTKTFSNGHALGTFLHNDCCFYSLKS